jgi:hypothetical protein
MTFSLLADIGPALPLVFAMGIISFGLLVYYIVHVINSKIDNNEKILWMFFFSSRVASLPSLSTGT